MSSIELQRGSRRKMFHRTFRQLLRRMCESMLCWYATNVAFSQWPTGKYRLWSGEKVSFEDICKMISIPDVSLGWPLFALIVLDMRTLLIAQFINSTKTCSVLFHPSLPAHLAKTPYLICVLSLSQCFALRYLESRRKEEGSDGWIPGLQKNKLWLV